MNLEDIVTDTARAHGMMPTALKGPCRDRPTARARQEAMYDMLMQTDCTLAECGAALGGRTPATVTWGFQKIANERGKQ